MPHAGKQTIDESIALSASEVCWKCWLAYTEHRSGAKLKLNLVSGGCDNKLANGFIVFVRVRYFPYKTQDTEIHTVLTS